MATSKQNFFDFLARTSNIGGSALALGTLTGTAIIDLPMIAVLGMSAVGYSAGYLLFSPNKKNLLLDNASDIVELKTIQQNIEQLKSNVHGYSNKLPDDILAEIDRIFEVLEEVIPRWDELKSFQEDKYTVNAIVTDYLPNTIANYINLPTSYYRNANKKKVGEELSSQLLTLLGALEKIRDNLYSGVEKDISTQSLFLKSRFAQPTGILQ